MTRQRAAAVAALSASAVAVLTFGTLVSAGAAGGRALKVSSRPEGAAVFVDGVYRGLAPATLEDLSEGDHTIRLEKAGFEPLLVRVTSAAARPAPLDLALTPTPRGTVQVTSKPSGAEVSLDGEFRGVTPLTVPDVPAGSHTIRIEKTNHNPWTGSVEVADGRTVTAHCALEDKVLEFLRRTVADSPKEILARMELGHYFMVIGDPENAAQVYIAAREAAAAEGVDRGERDRLEKQIRKDLMWQGAAGEQFRAAMRTTQAAPAPPPPENELKDPARALELAREQSKAGRPAAGAEILERGLVFNPNHRELLEGRATMRLVAGDNARAPGALEDAFKRTPGALDVRMRVAEASLENVKRFDEVRQKALLGLCAEHLAAARAVAGAEQTRSGLLLARLHVALRRGDQAMALFDALAAAAPGDAARAQVQLARGRALAALGRLDDARALLKDLAAQAAEASVRDEALQVLKALAGDRAP